MISLGLFSVVVAVLMVLVIFWLLRRDRFPIMHSVWWLSVALLVLLLGFFPQLIDHAASWVGITYPPSLLFIVAILVLLIKALLEDVDVSHDRRRILDLVQKVGMLEEQVNQLKQSSPPSSDHSDHQDPPK